MKKSELVAIIKECYREVLREDESAKIKSRYKELKSLSKKEIYQRYRQSFRVSTPEGEDKEGLISDILRAEFGNARVAKAFGLDE